MTLFTAYICHGNGKEQGYVLVSDNTNHEKVAVNVFLETLISDFIVDHPQIEEVGFFSDGASSQFKQRYLFTNLTFMFKKHKIFATWNFFATSHGKGVVDGIGGSVKRVVWRQILAGKLITTAEEFAETAAKHCPHLKIKFISSTTINE